VLEKHLVDLAIPRETLEEENIMRSNILKTVTILGALMAIGLFLPNGVLAHCDGLDGPVVKAAQKALEAGNVNLMLIWVQKKDEGEVKKAFQKTLAVRKLNPQAKELADMYFFETLVRIHRAGEGEPYTGLKPAGRDLGPAIPAADKALERGQVEPLLKILTETVQTGVRERFKEVAARKKFKPDDVDAGREYVEAYVLFLGYIERIYEAAKSPAEDHSQGSNKPGLHKEEKC
jgi:Family of unknown function (DUF6448)